MRPMLKALALSTFCLTLTAASCGERHVVTALPTPPERLVCEGAGNRPAIPPEYVIDWAKVATVAQAKSEHERYVGTIRTRENVIVGYITQIEGRLFVCSNNMAWRRDFEKGLK